MLREWIRNVPMALLRQIAADSKVRGTFIWIIACEELAMRQQMAA